MIHFTHPSGITYQFIPPESHRDCLDARAYQYFFDSYTLNHQGYFKEAFVLLEKAIHIPGGICDPNFRALLYQCKATTLYNQGLYKEALKTAELAREIPSFSQPLVQFDLQILKVNIYRKLKMYEDALSKAEQCIENQLSLPFLGQGKNFSN
ncbi:MAG: hypothetical protein KR126chlam3_00541 [Chlamydiae bacterium]|nr:hypothetical protein [Chlamydiota bacterium]